MSDEFSSLPTCAINYVRNTFAAANYEVSRALSTHPSMHEEFLDFDLIRKLSAAAPAFFASEQIGIVIESHWIGGRWLYERWEVADIALFVLLRKDGKLVRRKVALIQTKRLYSKEIPVEEIDRSDYIIGIGRLADRTENLVSLVSQRAFSFNLDSVYGAIKSRDRQVDVIDQYFNRSNIPVYYGLYNPLTIPFKSLYPATDGIEPSEANEIGCRILPSPHVHGVIGSLSSGQSPCLESLALPTPLWDGDPASQFGWRIENFVADEVLGCRQGRIFDDPDDNRLSGLLYRRSAPISSAITITIDVGKDRRD